VGWQGTGFPASGDAAGLADARDALRRWLTSGEEAGSDAQGGGGLWDVGQGTDEAWGDAGNHLEQAVPTAPEGQRFPGDPFAGVGGEVEVDPFITKQASGSGETSVDVEQEGPEIIEGQRWELDQGARHIEE